MADRWLLLLSGCCRQVSKLCFWKNGRQVVVIVRWLLLAGKYSRVSGSIVDRWLLFKGGCYRQVSIVVSLVVS